MDPLCHTLVGAALAGTRLGDRSWGARATLILGANLPDVDVVAYAWGADAALWFRRGWTHGILAIAVLPLLLAGAVHLAGRWRGAGNLRAGPLVLLAYLALLTHPLLDWLNTYGMRWLVPFDGRWFYGDALFIVDPWLWLILGGAAFLRFSKRRRSVLLWAVLAAVASIPVLTTGASPTAAKVLWVAALLILGVVRGLVGAPPSHAGRRVCGTALAIVFLYAAGMLAGSRLAESRVRERVEEPRTTIPEVQVFAGPLPATPLRRDLLLIEGDEYLPGELHLTGGVSFAPAWIPVGERTPAVRAALAAPCARGMATWIRYPWFRVAETPSGEVLVSILDARYAREVGRGFGATTVLLGADGSVLGCD